jgi:hypothetical protein
MLCEHDVAQPTVAALVKLRVGIVLWALSWVPYGIILGLSGAWYTVAWTFEILLGLVGITIAGSEFAQAIKAEGWKRAPAVAWHALRHGQEVDAPR